MKEPKSDNCLSKFDWYNIPPFFGHNASSEPKSILETNQTTFSSYSSMQ